MEDPTITNPTLPPAAPPIISLAEKRYARLTAFIQTPPESLDVDFVHDLRVLSRRVTEVARLVTTLTDPVIAAGVAHALRELRQAAGELRDLDVLREHLEKWRLPSPLRHVAAGILAALPQRRAALEERLRSALSGVEIQGMLLLLGRIISEQSVLAHAGTAETRMAEELQKLLRKRRRQMEKVFGCAVRKQTDTALHEARIGAKKLRYALEVAEVAGQRGAGRAVKTLKRIQELLGKHHDVSVITATLQAHLNDLVPPTPVAKRRLAAAWRSWLRRTHSEQARRAGDFFIASYHWRNSTLREVCVRGK